MKKLAFVLAFALLTGIWMTACGSQPAAGASNGAETPSLGGEKDDPAANEEAGSVGDILEAMIGSADQETMSADFLGSRSCDSEEFTLSYRILDTTEEWTLELSEGDSLSVDLAVGTGELSVLIVDEEGNVFYQNDSAETEAFDLEVEESGAYTITVAGSDTDGKVSFKRK